MGNQNCAEIYQHYEQNQAYGDFQIIKQNSKSLALVQKSLQNDKQLKQEVQQKLKIRLKLKSNHLVKLQKYEILENKYSTNIKMYYEYINKTLEDRYKQILQNDSNQANYFTQRQIFNIIYGVQSALQQLQKFQIRHGCLNFSTILCQGNFYKISDVSSTTFVKSYDLVRRGCRNQFLSQKLLTNLQYRSLQPFYDIQDDYFSLGMIILSLMLKVNSKHFYSWKQKNCTAQLKWDAIQTGLKKLQKQYSSKLSKKIKQLIGYEQDGQKSFQTNSTTVNNINSKSMNQRKLLISGQQNEKNISSHEKSSSFNDKNNSLSYSNIKQLNLQVKQLDKDIQKILSRVNTSHTNYNVLPNDHKIMKQKHQY